MRNNGARVKAALVAFPIVILAGLYVWTFFIPSSFGFKNGEGPLGFSLTILAFIVALTLFLSALFLCGVYIAVIKVYKKAFAYFSKEHHS